MASGINLSKVLLIAETGTVDERSWRTLDVQSGAGNKRSEQLHEAIQFSRWFVNLYHAAIGAVVICFAVRYWATVWKRRRRRSCIEDNYLDRRLLYTYSPGPSSSSSSTLEGDATPQDELGHHDSLKGERVPLLAASSNRSAAGDFKGLYRVTRAGLMYQPRPITLIHKELPSNSLSLVVLILLGVNLFFTFYRVPISIEMIFIAADRFGLMFIVNLPWLYILAAKNQPTRWLTSHSYESLNIFHRRFGELLCALAVLHFTGMLVVWYTILRPIGITFLRLILLPLILLGLLAFISYALLYITSLRSFRQRWYELFLGFHILLQVAGLAFLFFHYHTSRPYVIASMAIFLIDRIVFRYYARVVRVAATISVQPDNSTVILRAPVRLHESQPLLSSSLIHSWTPGFHVFISIPSLSSSNILQAHPFSIFSSPPSHQSSDEAILSLLIRAHDGFSGTLINYARTHQKTSVRLDGPYGSSSAIDLLCSSDLAVLVAGGSGIALTCPLAEYLANLNQRLEDVESGRRRNRSTNLRRRILFVWIYREAEHLSWLHDNVEGDRLDSLRKNGVDVVALGPTGDSKARPHVPELVEQWASEQSRRRGLMAQSNERPNVGVVACGPEGMMRDVRNGCAKMVKNGWDVDVEVERFGW